VRKHVWKTTTIEIMYRSTGSLSTTDHMCVWCEIVTMWCVRDMCGYTMSHLIACVCVIRSTVACTAADNNMRMIRVIVGLSVADWLSTNRARGSVAESLPQASDHRAVYKSRFSNSA
jgi:hypothetical protein